MDIIPQLILNSIITGAIYALLVLGFNLIYGATKFFNLAHGALAVVGGYAVFFLYKISDLNIFLAIALGLAMAGIAGWGLDKLVFLPLRKRKASNLVLLVASLGAFIVIQAIIAILFTSQFQTLSRGSARIYAIFGATITDIQLVILLAGMAIMAGLVMLLKKTMFGKTVRAISDDEEVAKIVGIDTEKIISRVFFMGSAIAGLGGILIGFDTGLEPTMGMNLLLKGVIASIIGGIGNIYGGMLGALLLGFAENFGIWKISGEWKDAIAFGILILFLIFRPRGIMNK